MGEAKITRKDEMNLQEMDWGSLSWFTSRAQDNSETLTTGMCVLHPGMENGRHYHPNCEEVLHVLQGKILHTVGDEGFEMSEGDTISLPLNVAHNAKNIGDCDAKLFICFSSADRQTTSV